MIKKDIKNFASKQIFTRWQAELFAFNFEIDYIKGEYNFVTNFITREFLQGTSWSVILVLSNQVLGDLILQAPKLWRLVCIP